jgi:plasmid stabilization system protein ParE
LGRFVYAPDAQQDVRAHIRYLLEHGETERADRFEQELLMLERRLMEFPRAGRELIQGSRRTLRRIGLRRMPLFVWYMYEPEREEITVVRLFHVKQLTPPPRIP